ncbi:protein of unknown function [Methylocaldum szegediense]|uniref:Uncharacterized protein n=1 Tax=Methylocaldum szegediense TaxID=73780 RepID=A0ABM9HWK6_9GAMM|nr:protein of unknown function [Methylocaldum szegediense]
MGSPLTRATMRAAPSDAVCPSHPISVASMAYALRGNDFNQSFLSIILRDVKGPETKSRNVDMLACCKLILSKTQTIDSHGAVSKTVRLRRTTLDYRVRR